MSELDLILDLHLRNARQGPGSASETRRAIELARLDPRERLVVADLGCGTGASSVVLAKTLNAHVIALDFAAPFIDRLRARVSEEGLSDRIEGVVGLMESLPFRDEQFDVIWSEGAIYTIGFGEGLRAWRRCLRPGGVVAVTEMTWTTATRPERVEAHWTAEYPGIATASAKLRIVEEEGYEPLGLFFLPSDCWERNYYEPLRAGFPAFLARHGHSEPARRIVHAEEAEMSLFREYGAWYGYAFYIARKVGGSAR